VRTIGLDVHRRFAQVAILEGTKERQLRIATEPDALREFAGSLGPDDQVVVEAIANTWFRIAASRPSCAAACSEPA
jgi:transposase